MIRARCTDSVWLLVIDIHRSAVTTVLLPVSISSFLGVLTRRSACCQRHADDCRPVSLIVPLLTDTVKRLVCKRERGGFLTKRLLPSRLFSFLPQGDVPAAHRMDGTGKKESSQWDGSICPILESSSSEMSSTPASGEKPPAPRMRRGCPARHSMVPPPRTTSPS